MTVPVALPRRHPVAAAVSFALVAVVALGAPAAHANDESLPLYLTLSQSVMRDSNLLRDDSNKQADTVSTTAVRGGLNKAYGRQNYRLDVTANHNKYSNNDQFNYNGFVSSGEVISDFGSNFRFTGSFAASEVLPKFEDSQANRTARNIQKTTRVGTDLRYGLYGRLSVNGGLSQSKLRYRETTRENKDSSSWNMGVRYLPNDLMYYGLSYTQTDTDLPNFRNPDGTDGEEVTRRSINFVTSWRATGFSQLNASVGYTRERNDNDPRRDFNGVTGQAAWTFTPAGKVRYRVSWLRDTNNQGGFTLLGGASETFVSQDRVVNQYGASATWQATSKISATVQLTHARYEEGRSVSGLINESENRDGRLNSVSLGLEYQPIRSLNVGCDVQKYDRTASVLSRAYSGQALSCSLGFTLD